MFTSKSINMVKQKRLELYAQLVSNMDLATKPTKFKMSNQLIAARALCAFDLMPPGAQELLLPVLNQLEFSIHFAIRNKPGMIVEIGPDFKQVHLLGALEALAELNVNDQFVDLLQLIKSSDWPIIQLLIHNCFNHALLAELIEALILH